MNSCANTSTDRDNKGLSVPPTDFGIIKLANDSAQKIEKTWIEPPDYSVINQVISKEMESRNIEKLMLLDITTADISRLEENYNLSTITPFKDSFPSLQKLGGGLYKLDCTQLKNVSCISVKTFLNIFGNRRIRRSWEQFHVEYGVSTLNYISLPVYNSKRDLAIIIFGAWGHNIGAQELLYLKKENQDWNVINRVSADLIE
jgi:hypothetical protein